MENKKIKVSTVIDEKVMQNLDTFCKAEGRHKSFVIEKVLKEFLEKNGFKTKS